MWGLLSTDVSRAVCESPRIRIDDGYTYDSAVGASGEPKAVGTTSEYEVIDSGAVSSDRAVTPPVGTPIASSSPVLNLMIAILILRMYLIVEIVQISLRKLKC